MPIVVAPLVFVTGLFLIHPHFQWTTEILLEQPPHGRPAQYTLRIDYKLSIHMPLTPGAVCFDDMAHLLTGKQLYPPMQLEIGGYARPISPPPTMRLPDYFLRDVELWHSRRHPLVPGRREVSSDDTKARN